jgi:hypothetical protein
MSETTKSGLRQIATITAAGLVLLVLAVTLILNVNGDKPKHSATAKFLYSKFVNGEYLEGFTPGSPEYGFSLEALAQLSSNRELDLGAAKGFLLESSTEYLYSPEGELIWGLAGKFLFTSKVAGATNREATDSLISELRQLVGEEGSLSEMASTFDYAWLTLGLYAQDERELAAKVAGQLALLAREDGGWGFDQSEFTVESSTDATAMAIQALELTKTTVSSLTDSKQNAIDQGLYFLETTLIDGNHFVAYEADDVNGTALAYMALKASTGGSPESIRGWLVSKLMADGGLGSPWVEAAGDPFATAQGYLALEGKSYLDLISR